MGIFESMGEKSLAHESYLYKPRLELTDGVWLSDRVLLSDMVRRRLFSPSLSAWRQGRSASGFYRSTSVLDVAAPHCIRRSRNRDRSAAATSYVPTSESAAIPPHGIKRARRSCRPILGASVAGSRRPMLTTY